MKSILYTIFLTITLISGPSMAKEELNHNKELDDSVMNQAESGDFQKALHLYEHYAMKEGNREAAKYWLMIAAMGGSTFAKVVFASDFNNQTEFEKSLSRRWIESIDLEEETDDTLARIFSIKGDIFLNSDNEKAIEHYAYAAYLDPDAHKTRLIEYCNKLKNYRCVYVWSKYLFSDMRPDKQYFSRLQAMESGAKSKIKNVDSLDAADSTLKCIPLMQPAPTNNFALKLPAFQSLMFFLADYLNRIPPHQPLVELLA